jgi:hypothetical protein
MLLRCIFYLMLFYAFRLLRDFLMRCHALCAFRGFTRFPCEKLTRFAAYFPDEISL